MDAIDVVCLGEPLREFNQDKRASDPSRFLAGYGGDTSNVAIAAARQGARAAYVTRIGDDVFGDDFLALWQREGVDASGVSRDRHAPTGVYFVTHADAGHVFTYRRAGSAASRMTADDLPIEILERARFLHASGVSQAISEAACDTVFAAVGHAKRAGAKVSYDANLRLKLWPLARARAVIHAAAALADILLPSLEDASALTGIGDPDAIADFYLAMGTPLVVLKLGPDGALVATPGRRERIAGRRVAAVDATGAGDAFDGALLAELARGRSPFEAARYANAAAALSTRGYGAVAPIPKRPDVEAFLDEGR